MSQSTITPAARTPDTTPHLPAPPTDAEKYSYFGRQNRWLLALQAVSFCFIAYSVGRFATADDRLVLFLVPTSLYAVALAVSLVSSTHRRRIDRVDHELLVSQYAPDVHPSVDVFLPSAGEPLDLLANTYEYVSRLDWPGRVAVHVLDDSAREAVRELAGRYGFVYSVRPNRGFLKKAGNLRHGYENSDGDVIVILDADFVPRPDFLHELVPYLDDPTVGIVQSPQFFETSRRMGWLQRCAGATQELFYRMIQPSRDAVDAAICVGTCAIYRRAALDAAGGFAQIGHSEDVHTGVKMLKAGFVVRYVPVVVSRGICPDTARAFLNQQYRWCSGSMSLLRDPSFHAATQVKGRQRMCFWAGFLYYISTALNAFLAPVPALTMLFLLPRWVKPMNSVWLLGAVLLWLVVLPCVMRGRWRIDVLRVQAMYSFAHAVAIAHVLTGRTKDWVATGASTGRSTPIAVTVGRVMKTWVLATQVLIWFGLVQGVRSYGFASFWAMIALAVVASWIQVPLLFVRTGTTRAERQASRAARRSERAAAALADRSATATPAEKRAPVRETVGTGQHPAADGPRRWRPDIQGLRAVAVTLVVLYHADVPGLTGGYVGVDVFFVISGFLITGQLLRQVEERRRINVVAFYVGRIRRLLPAAALVTVVTVLAARQFLSIFQVQKVVKDAVSTAYYGINYRLAAEGVNYQQATETPSPLQHFWSLAVEEQFYIGWPLLIGLCAWIGRRHFRRVVLGAVVAVVAVSLWLSVTQTASNPPLAYFAIHTRAWELGVGALVAVGVAAFARVPVAVAGLASWLGVAGVVYAAFHYDDATAFPGTAALLPVLATALVIAAGCRPAPARWGVERLLRVPPVQQVGKLSYAWYLWHWPMLIIVPVAFGYEFTWKLNLELAALSLWFAVLTLHLLERPTQRGRLRRSRWALGGVLVAALVVGGAQAVQASLPDLNVGSTSTVVGQADSRTLQNTVGASLGIKHVPADLVPNLQAAPHDVPVSDHDGCHADFLVVKQPACVFGDPQGVHTLALVGDSHAQQWLPALDREAKLVHWRVVAWTKAACSIADLHLNNDALHREFKECDTWRKITMGRIKQLDPDIVVASQSDNVPGTQFSNTTWADATAKAMTTFSDEGLRAVYVMDTPVPVSSGPDCVAEHIDDVSKCIRSRKGDSIYTYKGRHEAMAGTLAAAHVTTVEPADWLCTAAKCPMVIGNILVYRDASHMSASYSRFLAPMTVPLFHARSS